MNEREALSALFCMVNEEIIRRSGILPQQGSPLKESGPPSKTCPTCSVIFFRTPEYILTPLEKINASQAKGCHGCQLLWNGFRKCLPFEILTAKGATARHAPSFGKPARLNVEADVGNGKYEVEFFTLPGK
jgi:hypothetical protein